MFGFLRGPDRPPSRSDFRDFATKLFVESNKYQSPTVDGLCDFLNKSDQLQFAPPAMLQKGLNISAACTASELFARRHFHTADQIVGNAIDANLYVKDDLYSIADEVTSRLSANIGGTVDISRIEIWTGVRDALEQFGDRDNNASADISVQVERLEYELVRVALRAFVVGTFPDEEDNLILPRASSDWKELSLSISGLAKSYRWIESSLGKRADKLAAD